MAYAQRLFRRGKTRKLQQLLGEVDRQYPARPVPRTFSKYALFGADCGAILDFGRARPDLGVIVLFGDTWTGEKTPDGGLRPVIRDAKKGEDFFAPPYTPYRPFNGDAIGMIPPSVTAANADQLFELEIYRDVADQTYASLDVPGVDMLSNRVPTGAAPTFQGAVVFVSGVQYQLPECRCPQQPPRMWIAPWKNVRQHRLDDAYEFSLGPFANFVCPVTAGAPGQDFGGVEAPGAADLDEPVMWIWGTGLPSRSSSVRLGRARLHDVMENPSDRGAWEFFTGLSPTGKPRFGDEAAAVPLFDASCVGELSVAWNPFLNRWLMLYNCRRPRGIICRSAPQPWGPWDPPLVIFDPSVGHPDHGYRHFMHLPSRTEPDDRKERDDGLADPGRPEPGGEYAPMLIPRFTTGGDGWTTIRYLMSTWNPYTVVLMETGLFHGLPDLEGPVMPDDE